MDKKFFLALIDVLLDEKLNEHIENSPSKRGPRGLRGPKGDSFEFSDHEETIKSIINDTVDQEKEYLKLKFEDLTSEEKDDLKFKFEDLSKDQIDLLRGPRGYKGQKGQSFRFEDHKETILEEIKAFHETLKDDLKLKFDDLSDEDKFELKGPKGLRGRDGKSFDFEESKEEIFNEIKSFYDESKPDLKLKFSDLTEEEKESLKLTFDMLTVDEVNSLRGPRGLRGQRGKQGPQGEDGSQGIQGEKGERGDIGPMGPMGAMGAMGVQGPKGEDAPEIINIEVIQEEKDEIKFAFQFSDNTEIVTNKIILPTLKDIVYAWSQVHSSGGGGGTSDPLNTFRDGVLLGETENLDFVGDYLNITYDSNTKTTSFELDLPEYFNPCITVQDEGVTISECVKSINFIGNYVEVSTNTVMADWDLLSNVDSIGLYEVGEEGQLNVKIDPRDVNEINSNVEIDGNGTYYEIDTAGVVVDLPLNPEKGLNFTLANFSDGFCTIDGNGNTILGELTQKIFKAESFHLKFNGNDWKVI